MLLPRILPIALSIAGLASLPASALNISGLVVDKSFTPLWSAKVCVTSAPTVCVTTDIKGAFHILTATGLRDALPRASGYEMELRNGMLTLIAPAAGKARLEWIGAGGRTLLQASALDLARGRNSISLPASLPGNGVSLVRLNTESMTTTWKVVRMGSQGRAASAAKAASRIVSLSKVASAGTLTVTKSGYKDRLYAPATDPEDNAVIALSTTDDVGLNYTGIFHDKVVSIDRNAKRIITQAVYAACDSVNLVRDTTLDTNYYAFRDGKFWLWVKGECGAQVFTGTGTDPVGTWTLTDPNSELPADLGAGCVVDTTTSNPPFDSYAATYTLTETTFTGNLSVEFCAADLYGPAVYGLLQDTAIGVDKNTCNQVVLVNPKNLSATLNFSKRGADSLQVAFTYKSTTCSFVQPLYFGDEEPTCPEDDTFNPFFYCLAGSGFSDSLTLGSPAAKTSASPGLPMSLEKRLPALPSFRTGRFGIRRNPVPASPSRRGSIFPFYGWRPGIPR